MHIWYCLYFVATVSCRGNKKNQTRSMRARNALLAMLLNHFSSILNMNRIFFLVSGTVKVIMSSSLGRHMHLHASLFFYTFATHVCFQDNQPMHHTLSVEDAEAGSNSSLKHTHPHWTALSDVDVSCCTLHQSCKVDRQCKCRTQLWTGPTEPVI